MPKSTGQLFNSPFALLTSHKQESPLQSLLDTSTKKIEERANEPDATKPDGSKIPFDHFLKHGLQNKVKFSNEAQDNIA